MNRQLTFLDDCTPPSQEVSYGAREFYMYVDGASRNNPGKAGIGIVIKKSDTVVAKHGYYVGIKTNNEAEYLALIIGLFIAKELISSQDMLYIMSDSELLVRQLKGEYKVKSLILRPYHTHVLILLEQFTYSLCHVRREFNQDADALANDGIDAKRTVPLEYRDALRNYDIVIE